MKRVASSYPQLGPEVPAGVRDGLFTAFRTIYQLESRIDELEGRQQAAPSLAQIRAALSARGSYPLKVYDLLGSPATDLVIPGAVLNFSMSKSGSGKFVAEWNDPLTGANSLDDTAIQWADDSAFTVNVQTAKGWGRRNHLESKVENETHWFRVAVHNESCRPSDPSTWSTLGEKGWGPWCTGVQASSGTTPGAALPTDTVNPDAPTYSARIN